MISSVSGVRGLYPNRRMSADVNITPGIFSVVCSLQPSEYYSVDEIGSG